MPHTKSAKKRLRQNEERRIRNKNRTTELKSLRKDILRAVHDGKTDEAKSLYRDFTKCIDQAASLRVIHANAAARSKARMARVITGGPEAAAVVAGSRGLGAALTTKTPGAAT
jgi:small subunit ribosomal protein S20